MSRSAAWPRSWPGIMRPPRGASLCSPIPASVAGRDCSTTPTAPQRAAAVLRHRRCCRLAARRFPPEVRRGQATAPDAAGDTPARGSRRRALAALCVTEIVSYGVIYYAFPVMATQIAAGTGWSRTAVTAAYSAGNLAGALAGVPAGRLLHRYGPRPVMTFAGVLAAVAVAGIAAAPSYAWFLAAWLVAGVATAGLFYPPAFAALTA